LAAVTQSFADEQVHYATHAFTLRALVMGAPPAFSQTAGVGLAAFPLQFALGEVDV